jgi:hypothetical protein
MTLLRRAFPCGLFLCAAILPAALAADDKKEDANAAWMAEHYTKYEHRIPMRDGVKLFTRRVRARRTRRRATPSCSRGRPMR